SFWAGIAGMAAVGTFASTYGNVALAGNSAMRMPLSSLSIPIDVLSSLGSQSLDRWECSVSAAIANEIGKGAQIRVRRNANEFAAYTIVDVRAGDSSDVVRMSSAGRG